MFNNSTLSHCVELPLFGPSVCIAVKFLWQVTIFQKLQFYHHTVNSLAMLQHHEGTKMQGLRNTAPSLIIYGACNKMIPFFFYSRQSKVTNSGIRTCSKTTRTSPTTSPARTGTTTPAAITESFTNEPADSYSSTAHTERGTYAWRQ